MSYLSLALGYLFYWTDEVVYFVTNAFDPIPPHKPKESVAEYVGRLDRKHALRHLKYRIHQHLDLDEETIEKSLSHYKRKKDVKILRTLVSLIDQAQREDLSQYNELLRDSS